jgi:signal transduction histidine kinase
VVFAGPLAESLLTDDFLLSFGLTVLFSGGIVYGAHWLERSALDAERYPRIAKWFALGMAVYLGINVPMIVVWSPESLQFMMGWVRNAAAIGGVGGLLIGISEARTIQRELAAQRATIRAEEAETQRQCLDYLNGILRHEVLNTANVITGYASVLLDDELDDDARAHLETIHRRGTEMTNVIQDVRVLIESTKGPTQLEATNLTDVLSAELDDLGDIHPSVEVESSLPNEVYVIADDLLSRVFSNLLTNAIEHNDSSTPEVSVTVEAASDTVTVRIADNGPGIPDSDRSALYERSDNTGSNHGLGLYLVRTLVERYDGTVELVDTGDDGSTFAVELPLADPERRPTVDHRATHDAALGTT